MVCGSDVIRNPIRSAKMASIGSGGQWKLALLIQDNIATFMADLIAEVSTTLVPHQLQFDTSRVEFDKIAI